MSSSTGFGMMDPAYFVGRKEILEWVNSSLDLNLSKVEQTASGAVACQLLDRLYPGKIPMSKVNWDAKADYEYVNNYKILQNSFQKLKIDKHIEVERLIRAKYQDNLEFMQWFKRFYELQISPNDEYDAQAKRSTGKGGSRAQSNLNGGAKATGASGNSSSSRNTKRVTPVAGSHNNNNKTTTTNKSGRSVEDTEKMKDFSNKISDLKNQNAELQITAEGLEKERDFYFEKLSEIEELLKVRAEAIEKDSEESLVADKVFKILYATSEDFEVTDQEAVVTEE